MGFVFIRVILYIEIIRAKLLMCFDRKLFYAFNQVPSYFRNKFSFPINGRSFIARFIFYCQCRDSILLGHFKVIGTKGWRNMYHARAIFSGNKISGHNLECFVGIIEWFEVGHELFVAQANQVFSRKLLNNLIRDIFITRFVIIEFQLFILFQKKS